jgi:AAA domain
MAKRPVCLAEVKPEPVEWLWWPYIPKGKLTSFEGDPGCGKSWLTLKLVADLSLGLPLPGSRKRHYPPTKSLVYATEDGMADTLRPRLDALGADCNYAFGVEGAFPLDEAGLARVMADIETIRPRLVIFDPILAYLPKGTRFVDAGDVTQALAPLQTMAHRFHVAICFVRHLTKAKKSDKTAAIYRGIGSIAFTGSCRSCLLIGKDPDNSPDGRLMAHAKCNLERLGPTQAYSLAGKTLTWLGESEKGAEDINEGEAKDGRGAKSEAVSFLKLALHSGPVLAVELFKRSQEEGIAEATLKRAKKQLGIKSRNSALGWRWELPG